MKELKKRLELILTLVMLVSGWGVWWLMSSILTEHYFRLYPIIPSFFYVVGLVFIYVITRDYKGNPRTMVNLYMLIRLGKIAASLLFGGIYYVFIKEKIRDFSLVFCVFYLLYLGLETYFFYLTEENNKNKI